MRLAILLLLLPSVAIASTRTVSIRTSSPLPIAETLKAVAKGAAGTPTVQDLIRGETGGLLDKIPQPRVWLDGVEVDCLVLTNFRRIIEDDWNVRIERVAVWIESVANLFAVQRRIRGFIDDTDTSGSVEYTYAFTIRGLRIDRRTRITDGRLILDTRITGRMDRIDYARLVIDATEYGQTTSIIGTLTAHTPIGDDCGLMNRFALRVMGEPPPERHLRLFRRKKHVDPMANILWTIERRARELGRTGSESSVLELFVQLIRGGLR